MVQLREAIVKSETKPGTAKRTKKGKGPTAKNHGQIGTKSGSKPDTPKEESLFGKSDQINATFSKGLDLAEAGLSLGLTLINRFGTMVQDSVLEKFSGVLSSAPGPSSQGDSPSNGPDGSQTPSPPSAQDTDESLEAQDPSSYIVNRLPLSPEQPVSVSFSINNDSLEASKKVKVAVEGFVGFTHGQSFSAKGFSVTPSSKVIAPMDFEKFVLKGKLPAGLQADIYQGRIIVMADQAFDIPVKLMVTSGA